MKKLLSIIMVMLMAFAMCNDCVSAQETDDSKDYFKYLWDLSGDLSDEEFGTLALRNYKFIQSLEPLIEEDSFKALYKANVHLKQNAEGSREEFIEAQNNIEMKLSVADGVIFLWDKDNIPAPAEDAELTDEELDAAPLDGVGFVPLIVKCLLDDPSQAKGNIIAISGGAGKNRSNSGEAYPAVDVFNELGYNVFVLQYRIAPYSRIDMGLDTQRAVRLVRYYAEQEGWGGQDMIACAGWSAGASCIMNAVNNFYGDINGTKVDDSYVPDEIDLTVNSDMDVAMPIYGGGFDEYCENPNIPAMYLCVGSEDTVVGPEGEMAMYDYAIAHGIPAVIHIMEGAGHGFGVGQEGALKGTEECALWPGEADQFMMVNKGHSQGVAPTGVYTLENGIAAE